MPEHCSECRCPLDGTFRIILGPWLLCNVCFEMWVSVVGKQYWLNLQQEYVNEVIHKERIRNGD